jgi:hypothetical protein
VAFILKGFVSIRRLQASVARPIVNEKRFDEDLTKVLVGPGFALIKSEAATINTREVQREGCVERAERCG